MVDGFEEKALLFVSFGHAPSAFYFGKGSEAGAQAVTEWIVLFCTQKILSSQNMPGGVVRDVFSEVSAISAPVTEATHGKPPLGRISHAIMKFQ